MVGHQKRLLFTLISIFRWALILLLTLISIFCWAQIYTIALLNFLLYMFKSRMPYAAITLLYNKTFLSTVDVLVSI